MIPLLELSEEDFDFRLTQFLYSPKGSRYRPLFRYKEEIQCGKNAPDILVSFEIFYVC